MSDTTWKLRAATTADRETIAKIWHGGASLPGVGPDVMPTQTELLKRVDEEFAAGWTVTLAVDESGTIAGFVAIKPRDSVLAELFVRPGATGGGIGRRLLIHAKISMPNGFTLFTRSSNDGARRFYEREGLAKLRESRHPRTDDPVIYYGWKPNRSLPA